MLKIEKRWRGVFLAFFILSAITGKALYSSTCSWLADDPGERREHLQTSQKHTLTIRVSPRDISTVQVYSGRRPGGPVEVDMELPYCRRIRYEHLVSEKKVDSSDRISFTLPQGKYFVIALIDISKATKEMSHKAIHYANPQNIYLDRDLVVTPPKSNILEPLP